MTTRRAPRCRPVTAVLALLVAMWTSPANAQQENPVYVDDSPQAWELFRRAADQVRENTAESVRLYQELLDDFGLKLIPAVASEPDYFASVRSRVLAMLRSDERLLERYRQIQTPQAQQMLDAGDLLKLARTRSLTEPGLEAILRLAQEDLEAARFHSALAWLDQALNHPDLSGRRAAHAHFMRGLALHDLKDLTQARQEIDALTQLGADGETFRAQLEHLINANDQPVIIEGSSTLHQGHATDLNDLVAQAIWSVPLEDSLMRRRFTAPGLDEEQFRNNFPQRVQEADLATTIATSTPINVFVNQGNTVMALNRLTGRKQWTYTDQPRLELVDREGEPPLDLSVVAVSGDSLVTLTGHANAAARSSQGQVVCLDATTGVQRWTNPLRSISGVTDEELFPHGAPVIADGLVFVAARRVSQQLLTSAYVVALDLADGRVRWSQYVTSSGGLRASPRPFCSLIWDDGSLYVASPVGAVAKLDPASGEILWLRRYNVPLAQPIIDQARRPWELTAPVITRRGVVAIEPDQRRIILLDRATGDQLESYSATSTDGWYSPRYLLADDQRVYGIGTEIRAFDIDALEHPAWRLPAAQVQQTAPEQTAPTVEPLEIRGRVQLVDESLVVPTAKGVLVVNSETGIVRHQLPVENPGNPLAVDSQLVLACADRIDSYMSFAKAERMLRDRIVQAPAEPEPALSLLRLGMKVRSLPLALEAADLAMKAVNQMGSGEGTPRKPSDARAELFSLMLDLAASRIAETDEQGESVYAVTGSVAIEPEQRVEYLLRYGDWLAGHAVERSVETYQTILSDPILASTPRMESGVARNAAEWTTDHLRQLVAQRGAMVYAPQADFARTRMAQLSGPEADPAELANLSQEFPFADAAADAAISAADRWSKAGQPRLALATLKNAITVASAPPVNSASAGRLLAAYARISQDAGWVHQASAALRMAVQLKIDSPLGNEPGGRTARQWLAAMGMNEQASSPRASVGDAPGDGKNISGAFVPPQDNIEGSLPLDRVLLRDGAALKLIAANTLEPTWTSTIETDLPEILRFDDRAILVWMGADPEDPKAILLNAADGKLKWTTPRLSTILPADAVRDLGNIRAAQNQMPDGEPFDPRQTIPLVNGRSLVLAQRTGTVVCFDLPPEEPVEPKAAGDAAPAGTVRWTRAQTLDQIHMAALTDFGLVLVGRSKPSNRDDAVRGEGTMLPAILVLNPQTGEPLYDEQPVIRPMGRNGVKWISIDPFGGLVCASLEGLEGIDLLSGRTRWSNSSYAALDSQHGWGRGQRLVIEDRRARLRTVDLQTGTASEQFDVPSRTEWDPMDLRSVLLTDDRAVVHYRQRVVMYDYKGSVAGYDVVTDERDYRWLLAASDRFLAISGKTEQAPIPDQSGRRMQYTYRIYAMSDNGKMLSEPWALKPLGDRVQQVMLLNNRLLLSTQSETVVMPMGK